ncbi:MAG: DUF1499 domain-containing protein [Spirochaetota bacterium]
MKSYFIISIIVFISVLFRCSGTRPQNIGVMGGMLSSCPESPNCVSSQAGDSKHYIEPIRFAGDKSAAMQKLKSVILAMKRTRIISEKDDYLYAEFTSAIFRFVDDVEFYIDGKAGLIHMRSASRLGYGDMGVNRKRMEKIKISFSEP